MERDEAAPRGGYSSASYLAVLNNNLPTMWEPGLIFMQDNASIHTAAVVNQFFIDMGIPRLEWPPISPDMNPIEHAWPYLKALVHQLRPDLVNMGTSTHAYKELIETISKAWELLTNDLFTKLIASMQRRIDALIEAEGWHTRY